MTTAKVIVITGASSGIGKAIAKARAAKGDKIVLGARREDRLQQIQKAIEQANGTATYAVTDVTELEQVKALAQQALDSYGRIDVWINNAGLMPHSLLIEAKVDDWNRMIDVNLRGTLYGIAAAQGIFHEQNEGHFINLGSVASLYSHAGGAVYSATKWAVKAISESLREEEAQAGKNVRVTTLYPGAVKSELVSHMTDPARREATDKFYDQFAIPAERIAKVVSDVLDMPADATLNEIVIRPSKQVQ
ncbi:SDR family oxidoreductase [Convivina praedatoris]|uniref:Oxidoreductase n=1 Tax=Convivina praedatoris TaxID=2880963 RepID=A0ABM9D0P5_9LACO|nr:SDR family oxidoreductase [Convivina sp. LMG 32447]CAH1851984.1 putative oxidoreductase [Convivina sp. LMG 32447]CAH1852018.1 putative oxidoreductase [Convivina sp. LMG 32447]CAH1852907.1 putative oxidoreductase [Convivina sp. LMG 32447]